MTAGHGRHGGPPGQPLQWQPPGPPPPYGYGPMPSPGHAEPPPEPAERPLTVRAGLGAFVASIVLSLAGSVFAFADWDRYVGQTLAESPALQDQAFQDTGIDPQAFVEGMATLFVVLSLVFAALYALFVWFAWRGHNWARIVLFVLASLGIAGGLVNLGGAGSSPFPSLTALSLFSFAALVAGVVLLSRPPSNEWYASEKVRRSRLR
jgi:hypothetical protein